MEQVGRSSFLLAQDFLVARTTDDDTVVVAGRDRTQIAIAFLPSSDGGSVEIWVSGRIIEGQLPDRDREETWFGIWYRVQEIAPCTTLEEVRSAKRYFADRIANGFHYSGQVAILLAVVLGLIAIGIIVCVLPKAILGGMLIKGLGAVFG